MIRKSSVLFASAAALLMAACSTPETKGGHVEFDVAFPPVTKADRGVEANGTICDEAGIAAEEKNRASLFQDLTKEMDWAAATGGTSKVEATYVGSCLMGSIHRTEATQTVDH